MSDRQIELYFAQFFKRFLENHEINISGYNELTDKEFKIFFSESNLIFDDNFLKSAIRDMLINIGLVANEKFKVIYDNLIKAIKEEYDSAKKNNQILALGIDTNIIYSGILLTGLYNQIIDTLNWRFPLIVISYATSEEIHYKRESKYYNNQESLRKFRSNINKQSDDTKNLLNKVFAEEGMNIKDSLYKQLLDRNGRLGHLGAYKLLLHRLKMNTIVVKSIHPYYSAKFSDDGGLPKGIDAIYDSLICNEFMQFSSFTNTKMLILTKDKPLYSLLKGTGIRCEYIELPRSKRITRKYKITHRQFSHLVRELLVISPYLIFELDDKSKIVLTMNWFGQEKEKMVWGIIHAITRTNEKFTHIWIKEI